MKTNHIFLLIIILIGGIQCYGQKIESNQDEVFLTILYDNRSAYDSIYADHGFSCLIESGIESCLFDAGRIPDQLILNMERLNINFSGINHIFISHIHNDHMGGLQHALNKCNQPDLYMPYSYPQLIGEPGSDKADNDWEALLDGYKPMVSDLIRVKESTHIGNIGYTTGIFENVFYEQSLIIPTSQGLVIITGCSHPGIVEIVKHAKKLMNHDVYLVLGGFHLNSTKPDEVLEIAQQLRELTRYLGPCHCTGEKSMHIFKKVFNEDYVDVKSGTRLGTGNILSIYE